jgi:hypothetical protein
LYLTEVIYARLLASYALLRGGALAFQHNALEFFKDWELLVSGVDLSVALAFAEQEADLFEALEFALDVASVFFYELGEASDMRLKIWVLRVDHDDFSAHTGCNKYV